MHLRITRGRFDPAAWDDLWRLGEEVLLPAMLRLPGLQSYQSGADRTSGVIVAVSTWETEEQARFSRDALGDILPQLQALGLQLEPPQIYEVTLQARKSARTGSGDRRRAPGGSG